MMQEQVLGYWVMMATQGGELQRWGHPSTPGNAFVAKHGAHAFADGVAAKSTCDSVYVMTVYDNGQLSMKTVCRPARDPSGPADDVGTMRRW